MGRRYGAGPPLKGPPAAALRPLPGGGEGLCGFPTSPDGVTPEPRRSACSRRRPGHPRLWLRQHRLSPAAQGGSPPPRQLRLHLLAALWTGPRNPARTRLLQNLSAQKPRSPALPSRPVLATVTCWLNSGNPRSEERGEALTAQTRAGWTRSSRPRLAAVCPSVASSFRGFLYPEAPNCHQSSRGEPQPSCLALQPLPPT